MRLLLVLSMLAAWALALWLWPDLPELVPIHFDLAGNPDGWASKSWWNWFALPALGTALGAALGLLVPWWMVRLARANSPWLNVPWRERFRALPTEARVRAVQRPAPWFALLAICVQVLLGWIAYGSSQVASGAWTALPPGPSFAGLALLLGAAAGAAVAGAAAVRREIRRSA
jgi:hypothetical protein